jgi:hypothetical protein
MGIATGITHWNRDLWLLNPYANERQETMHDPRIRFDRSIFLWV